MSENGTAGAAAIRSVITATAKSLMDNQATGWALAVYRDGEEIATAAGGWARAPWEPVAPSVAMTPDLRIHMASMSKPILCTAMNALVEDWGNVRSVNATLPAATTTAARVAQIAQLLNLDASFVTSVLTLNVDVTLTSPFLPLIQAHLVPVPPAMAVVTGNNLGIVRICDLLAHNSGIPYATSYGNYSEMLDNANFWLVTSAVVATNSTATSMPAGHNYDNWDYTLARAVIEAISGSSFVDYVASRVLRRANVPTLSVINNDPDFARVLYYPPYAAGAQPVGGEYPNYTTDCGPGGWYASPRSLAMLLSSITANALMSPAATHAMFYDPSGNDVLDMFAQLEHHYGCDYAIHNGGTTVNGDVNGCYGTVLQWGICAALMANSGGTFDVDGALERCMEAILPTVQTTATELTITNPLGVGDVWYTTDGSAPGPTNAHATRYPGHAIPLSSTPQTLTLSTWETVGPPPAQIVAGQRLLAGPAVFSVPAATVLPPPTVTSITPTLVVLKAGAETFTVTGNHLAGRGSPTLQLMRGTTAVYSFLAASVTTTSATFHAGAALDVGTFTPRLVFPGGPTITVPGTIEIVELPPGPPQK